MSPELTLEERRCIEFLCRLEAAQSRLDLTPWELQFIHDLVISPRPLTPAQRRAIQELETKHYGKV